MSGLLRVAATTGWFWWTLVAVLGAALVVVTVVRVEGRAQPAAIGAAVVVAAGFVGVFAVL